MKIILTSIGTRGDMEPLLAVGEILKKKGCRIICLFPEQFRNLTEDSGFEFESLGKEFIEMLNSPVGQIAMGGGRFGLKKLRAYIKLITMQSGINKNMTIVQERVIENIKPDRIVHNAKVMYPVIWSLRNKGKTVLISPVPYLHYVKNHAHVAFNKNFGSVLNKLTYRIANFALVKTITGSLKWLSNPDKVKGKDVRKALFENQTVYTISPTLFKKPDYWPDHINVLGYHERNKTNNWEPTPELKAFIQKHNKVILVTFGSMVNNRPDEKTQVILNILERHKIPAIINTFSGGLIEPERYNHDLIHFVKSIPYDWAFPKLYAVIHHGGSGTTHTALKYGCASLIIPHIIDQFAWNKIVFENGAGPLGIDISRITQKNLEPKIIELMTNQSFKAQAEKLGEAIRNENFESEIYQLITREHNKD